MTEVVARYHTECPKNAATDKTMQIWNMFACLQLFTYNWCKCFHKTATCVLPPHTLDTKSFTFIVMMLNTVSRQPGSRGTGTATSSHGIWPIWTCHRCICCEVPWSVSQTVVNLKFWWVLIFLCKHQFPKTVGMRTVTILHIMLNYEFDCTCSHGGK